MYDTWKSLKRIVFCAVIVVVVVVAEKVIREHRDFQNFPGVHTPVPPSLFRSKHFMYPNPLQ